MSATLHPDFFIVGAPKCGTTSMYEYLAAHPEIFMSPVKEPYHFCPDVRIDLRRVEDRSEYLSLFRGAGGSKRAGEASVWYLYSREAAGLIRKFNPSARIIVMLRSPVEMMHSLYLHYRYNGLEPSATFEEALAAEAGRTTGSDARPAGGNRDVLRYRAIASYVDQLARYLDAFGRQRVHVVLFEDLRERTLEAYRETLEFLDVAPGFVPDFRIANAARRPRSAALHRILSAPLPAALKSPARVLPMLPGIRRRLRQANTRRGDAAPISPATRARLQREFRTEVDRLAELLGRDLRRWHAPEGARP